MLSIDATLRAKLTSSCPPYRSGVRRGALVLTVNCSAGLHSPTPALPYKVRSAVSPLLAAHLKGGSSEKH
jgi:hypothetical protein